MVGVKVLGVIGLLIGEQVFVGIVGGVSGVEVLDM